MLGKGGPSRRRRPGPKLRLTYPVKLIPDRKDGGYVVSCRDIPEAITQGATIAEALAEAEGALQAAIESRIEDGLDIPGAVAGEARRASRHHADHHGAEGRRRHCAARLEDLEVGVR
jgi:predicted RNase H-like HicB family nuclease